jgi:hypothetical protein
MQQCAGAQETRPEPHDQPRCLSDLEASYQDAAQKVLHDREVSAALGQLVQEMLLILWTGLVDDMGSKHSNILVADAGLLSLVEVPICKEFELHLFAP